MHQQLLAGSTVRVWGKYGDSLLVRNIEKNIMHPVSDPSWTMGFLHSWGNSTAPHSVWVTSNTLDVRSGPGTNYSTVSLVLRKNNEVLIVDESGDWLKFAIDSSTFGYIPRASTTSTRPAGVPASVPLYSGAIQRVDVSSYSRPMRIGGPLGDGNGMAAFAWRRDVVNGVGTRSHWGVDFYGVAGRPVFAATGGYIRSVVPDLFDGFPGLDVENDDGTWIRYGEFEPAFSLSNLPIRIEKGQLLGHLVEFPNYKDISPMLHVAHYKGSASGGLSNYTVVNGNQVYDYVTYPSGMPYNKRRDLLDPTPIYNLPIW